MSRSRQIRRKEARLRKKKLPSIIEIIKVGTKYDLRELQKLNYQLAINLMGEGHGYI